MLSMVIVCKAKDYGGGTGKKGGDMREVHVLMFWDLVEERFRFTEHILLNVEMS